MKRLILFLSIILIASCSKDNSLSVISEDEEHYKKLLEEKFALTPIHKTKSTNNINFNSSTNTLEAGSYKEAYQKINKLISQINSSAEVKVTAERVDSSLSTQDFSSRGWPWDDDERKFQSFTQYWAKGMVLSASAEGAIFSSISCSTAISWKSIYTRFVDSDSPLTIDGYWDEDQTDVYRRPINDWAFTGLGYLDSTPESHFSGNQCMASLQGKSTIAGFTSGFRISVLVTTMPMKTFNPRVEPYITGTIRAINY